MEQQQKIIHYKFFGTHQIVHVEKRLFNFNFRIWFFNFNDTHTLTSVLPFKHYIPMILCIHEVSIEYTPVNRNEIKKTHICEYQMQMYCLCRTLNTKLYHKESTAEFTSDWKSTEQKKNNNPSTEYIILLFVSRCAVASTKTTLLPCTS